jgi:hypothetical protein
MPVLLLPDCTSISDENFKSSLNWTCTLTDLLDLSGHCRKSVLKQGFLEFSHTEINLQIAIKIWTLPQIMSCHEFFSFCFMFGESRLLALFCSALRAGLQQNSSSSAIAILQTACKINAFFTLKFLLFFPTSLVRRMQNRCATYDTHFNYIAIDDLTQSFL